MDAVDPQVVEAITALAAGVPGVAQVRETRARWAGRQLYIALVLAADPSLTLAAAHAIAERVRQEVMRHVPGASMVDIHVDPAGLEAEAHAPLPLGHDPDDPHSHTHEHGEEDGGHRH
jgi:divalent metal cation (Fe/Co/Zn/Cd) transporter